MYRLGKEFLHSFQQFSIIAKDGNCASFHLQSNFHYAIIAVAVKTCCFDAFTLAMSVKEMNRVFYAFALEKRSLE